MSKAAATSTSRPASPCVNTGHRHPKVIEAVKAQLDRFTHTCHQVVPYESYVALAERLNGMLPGKFDKKTIFVTTGAEAVENAIKIAPQRHRPPGRHRLCRRASTAAPSWAWR